MPYPNEHSCRLLPPRKDAPTGRGTRKHGEKPYDIIFQEQEDGSWKEQAYRYKIKTWDESSARSHCSSHDGSFEPAKKVKEGDITFLKKDSLKRIVYGIAMEPDQSGHQGEWASREHIEENAHDYLAKYQGRKLSHGKDISKSVDLVESYICPVDLDTPDGFIPEGTWIVAFRIRDDEIWKQIESGKIVGFSVGGYKTYI